MWLKNEGFGPLGVWTVLDLCLLMTFLACHWFINAFWCRELWAFKNTCCKCWPYMSTKYKSVTFVPNWSTSKVDIANIIRFPSLRNEGAQALFRFSSDIFSVFVTCLVYHFPRQNLSECSWNCFMSTTNMFRRSQLTRPTLNLFSKSSMSSTELT